MRYACFGRLIRRSAEWVLMGDPRLGASLGSIEGVYDFGFLGEVLWVFCCFFLLLFSCQRGFCLGFPVFLC